MEYLALVFDYYFDLIDSREARFFDGFSYLNAGSIWISNLDREFLSFWFKTHTMPQTINKQAIVEFEYLFNVFYITETVANYSQIRKASLVLTFFSPMATLTLPIPGHENVWMHVVAYFDDLNKKILFGVQGGYF